ncbi:phosphotransferase family protein [Nocardia speluncae]|uniref:Phosphotransferase family protein n=2 Tax=Nocardia speluncae TaxID=419477 RepID=A0A846XIJ8_9NOCA|nr:phosphotransferase family protein [Nocardia speluncae]NKY35175.1 phosphotransferase family protein [Nocardia speluncae]
MPDEIDPTEHLQLTTSERDLDTLAAQLTGWLQARVAADEPPVIESLHRPLSGGLSSASVLFDARWKSAGAPQEGSYVARMVPEAGAFPVFRDYDLPLQYRIIGEVAARTDVPVPPLRWLETDDTVCGAPFFVMDRVEGRIPGDNPPYVFAGWLYDAAPAERAELTHNTLDVLARIHAITEPARRFPELDGPGPALRRHLAAQRDWYRWALVDDGFEIPLIERAFDWLEHNFPDDPGPDVLSWGDARPGNIIYDGCTPAAILDWEMAALGPRELDLAWMIFLHRFFQDIATGFDMPGLPDFLRRDEVVAQYEELTGHTVRDLDFHLTYAALRHAIVMARIKRRMIHMGEDTAPADRDDYIMHRATLEAMLDGTYGWD